jgi:D-alanyl-D-alanine carboxypeptidase
VASWRIEFRSRARMALKVAGTMLVATGLMAAAPKATEANPKYAAIVVDTATGKVLYEKNADARRFPASLTKMMTLYVLFEELERGRFKLSSKLSVSPNAAAQPPSKLGLKPGQTISVEDAIKALVTKSANDAATAVGENVSGSIPAFSDRMTRTARALGMSSSVFRNASGLPDTRQHTTARDMMKLGVALQVRFPKYYGYFSTRSFTFRGRKMGNHNRLLGSVEGVDGIKTGYINASGFNLVSSVRRDGRRIVAVVMGGVTARSRDAHMRDLISTYLPKAKRAKGFDEDLVAMVKNAPAVTSGTVAVASATGGGVLGKHPRPVPRPAFTDVAEAQAPDPAMMVAAAVPLPEPAPVGPEEEGPLAQGDAEDSATAPMEPIDETRLVKTFALAVPQEAPVPEAVQHLPSSAHEAFADIHTGSTTTAESDALAAIIDSRIRATAFDAAETMPTPASAQAPVVVASVEPAPAPAERPTAAAVPREAIDGWMIQIGAVASEADAQRLLDKARSKAGPVLVGTDPVTETFEKGRQVYVRARFAGFDSRRAAQKACATLKKNDFACFALRL